MSDNYNFKGKTVVTTGLDVNDEVFVRKNVESRSGIFKPSFVKSLDMLVFNPQYYKETVKMRNTKELIENGYPVKMVTFTEFCKLITNDESSDNLNSPVSQGFHIENGVLVKYVEVTDDTEISIPEGISRIETYAFRDCKRIKKVVLPEGITSVGDFSFADCKSLEEVVLPEGLKEIGNAAFGDCNNLKIINIPDTVEKLGPQVFAGCYALERIRLPGLINEIDWNMFLACESLEEVIIEGKINKIEKKAFSGCKKLKRILLSDALDKICQETFEGCESLAEINIPKNVRIIGNRAFAGCTSLASVSLNPYITKIDYDAFRGCSSLVRLDLPREIKTITSRMLKDCASLEEIKIPYGVTKIEADAFSGCKSLRHISLPDTVNTIDATAFYDVPADAFTSYGNGLYLTMKGNPYYWFIMPADNSSHICEISSETVNMAYNSLRDCGPFREIRIPKNIQKLNTSIATEIKRLTIYSNLQNVQKNLFNVYGDFSHEIAVKSTETDEVLRVIPVFGGDNDIIQAAWSQDNEFDFTSLDQSFENLKGKEKKIEISITRLRYPTDLTEKYRDHYLSFLNANSKAVVLRAIEWDDIDLITLMGNNGLIKKVSIKSYIAEATKKNAVAITAYLLNYNNQPKENIPKPPTAQPKAKKKKEPSLSNWEFKKRQDGTYEITKYKGGKTEVEIPDEYHGAKITSIGESAFSGRRAKSCLKIEKIAIPDSIICIGESAFYHCEKLKALSLPNSLEVIGKNAFAACKKMKTFNLPDSVKKIGYGAFDGCSGLKEFIFPPLIKLVPEKVFDGCVQLETVRLGSKTTIIGNGAFSGCKRLKSIALPETVETIDAFAFRGCSALEDITLPDTLQTIGTLAFKGCDSLQKITIPKNAKLDNSVGSPFDGCENLCELIADNSNKHYMSKDGVLFDKSGAKLVRYPNTKESSYTIPEGVEKIGKFAFSNCSTLQSVTIPGSVRIIEDGAFEGCRALQHIDMSNGVEVIGKQAFTMCGITTINLPDSLKIIGDYAFSTCRLISVAVPEGTQEIGYDAFFQNRDLEKVTLPASLSKIGGGFYGSKVFDICPKVRVYAPKGSEAERYCIDNGLGLVESPDSF